MRRYDQCSSFACKAVASLQIVQTRANAWQLCVSFKFRRRHHRVGWLANESIHWRSKLNSSLNRKNLQGKAWTSPPNKNISREPSPTSKESYLCKAMSEMKPCIPGEPGSRCGYRLSFKAFSAPTKGKSKAKCCSVYWVSPWIRVSQITSSQFMMWKSSVPHLWLYNVENSQELSIMVENGWSGRTHASWRFQPFRFSFSTIQLG